MVSNWYPKLKWKGKEQEIAEWWDGGGRKRSSSKENQRNR
jgi:hypothetical protein